MHSFTSRRFVIQVKNQKQQPKTHTHAPFDIKPNEHIAFYALLSQRTNFIHAKWEHIAPQPRDYRQAIPYATTLSELFYLVPIVWMELPIANNKFI